MASKKYYLICYDIANPKRLASLHRKLKKIAVPIQYSVFLYHSFSNEIDNLINDMTIIFDSDYDDIRIYKLPKNHEIDILGQQGFAEGIYIFGSDNSYLSL